MADEYALYLDDIRHPPHTGEAWVLCRSLASMRELLEQNGIPYLASFDYELGRTDPSHCGEDAVAAFLDFICANAKPDESIEIEVRLHTSSGYGAAKMATLLNERYQECLKAGIRLVLR